MVLSDNDDSFEHKLRMVRSANQSIDLAYYIFSDDYTSSALSRALIKAAQRGVAVRMLLDYHANYQHLDLLSMMEEQGNRGSGSLQVRLYNRPTGNIVKDAVYLTMGCGRVRPEGQTEGCAEAKFAEIERLFADEQINGAAAAKQNVSNLNIGNSGLFLSGLYGKNPNLMAMAVSQGQNIDVTAIQQGAGQPSSENVEQLKQLGRIYWQSRFGVGVDRLAGRIKLGLAGLLFGEQIDPVFDTFTAYLPAERETDADAARRDWRYLTEFLHHKFLLTDEEELLLGGRNVEDSYHMAPNPLTRKYVFMDTDVVLALQGGDALTRSFDRLWNFRTMVADLTEVRTHAPNDFLVANAAASAECADQETDRTRHAACHQQALARAIGRSLAERMDEQHAHMMRNAAVYDQRTAPARDDRGPLFMVDAGADIYYLENLPWYLASEGAQPVRGYGAINTLEGEYGKHIHAAWLAAMRNVCAEASAASPQQVLMHNAYFFLPSNMMRQLAAMVDGSLDCRHVTIRVLTNSIETTDLNVVNVAARHAIKAFAEYHERSRDPQRAATVSYHEYRLPAGALPGSAQQSLHSKVMVFGRDIYIGSSNADVRSYMMDSNNGLFIRNAPGLVREYTAWADTLIANPDRTVNVTDYFCTTPRAEMLEEDLATQQQLLAKYRAERWIDDAAEVERMQAGLVRTLDAVYTLSAGSLGPGKRARQQQQRFNELFKGI
jgi:phosphatidylserine/phosphatidylglycerophosphate/cardiolipin synthase-like enzyme